MQSTLRPYATAGAAIVGAGLIAVIPMAAPLPHINTVRDVALTAGPGDDAFTIDGTTFDPFTGSGATATEGFAPVLPLTLAPPLLSLGGGESSVPFHLSLAPQSFDLYSGTGSSATDLGIIKTNETVVNLLGLPNTEFTVLSSSPATGVDASALPATGTVYDVLNLGSGTYNVYTATPDVGSTSGTVTDTLVTPSGNIDLSSLFGNINAANPLQPGDAFTGLQAGDSSIGADAFTIGDTTFDPFTGSGDSVTEGFTPVNALGGAPPLLNIGGGILPLASPTPAAPQAFDVYSGTGSNATELGSIKTGEDVTNLLGLPNTEFTVQHLIPTTDAIQSALADNLDFSNADFTAQDLASPLAGFITGFGTGDITGSTVGLALRGSINLTGSGITDADIAGVLNTISVADLPATGTVYDVLNLGNGWQNVYTATPDVGSTPGTVTDTLVTPFGNVNLDSLFGGINAANPLQPADAFTGLQAGDASIGADAFSLGGYTFDPFTGSGDSAAEGFQPVPSLLGAAPLLNIGGGTLNLGGITVPFASQDFDVYSGTGSSATEVGSITTTEGVGNVLGLTNTEFTVASVTPTGDATDADLPTVGTVYNVLNLGSGWENIYIATPGGDGTVTDTLVTPFGNVDLDSLFGTFNAANPFDPGDAFTGPGEAASAGTTAAASDPLAFLGL